MAQYLNEEGKTDEGGQQSLGIDRLYARRQIMQAFGAEVVLTPPQGGGKPGFFTREDIETAVDRGG